jgi:outer membrane protein assembly factor BamE (lipoprotein component of BamABCDE complex)
MRQMNMSILKLIPRITTTLLVASFLVIGGSCNPGKRITKANVDEVAEGMSKKQVESILGPPATIDNKDFIVMKKTTYVYRQGKDTVTIIFKDDKVTDKQSTLSD